MDLSAREEPTGILEEAYRVFLRIEPGDNAQFATSAVILENEAGANTSCSNGMEKEQVPCGPHYAFVLNGAAIARKAISQRVFFGSTELRPAIVVDRED